ncbi:uncharacterized protein LOC124111944 isoform X1 [Haliotis rufescens]|uniref:uncharacterized protein LOC124111944 isoform X1 n=1 Tax=Haliotis rufescens TaxID=6454 RepID=UPI00201F10E6|nr:uncharacterized protein LOC124111944 isoform X1 [Haliotis rufescens]
MMSSTITAKKDAMAYLAGVLVLVALVGCNSDVHGVLKINEDMLRKVGSPKAQKEAICRYLCGRGPVRTDVCFCRVSIPCMDSFCPAGKRCKRIEGEKEKLYACCPSGKVDIPPDCKRSPRVLQVRPHLSYYRYNVGNRRCEPSYLFTKEIKWQKIPGYLNAHMCKICTLFSFCEQSGDSLDALESIFNFEETVLKDFQLPEGENKVV